MNRITVGVFDTGYCKKDHIIYTNIHSLDVAIKFGEDMLRLLNMYPQLFIIFKSKNKLVDIPSLNNIYNQLVNHSRVDFRERFSIGASAVEVISDSDMVIGIVFTNAVCEALCCGVKSFFYDPLDKFKGTNHFFNRFPWMVAHGFDELIYFVDHWLHSDFVVNDVVKTIDNYHDGNSINRLCDLLLEDA